VKVHVARGGNSAAVRLPKAVVKQLGLAEGMVLDLSVDDGGVRLVPPPREPEPDPITLEWIVSEMRRLGRDNEPETVDWGPDVGSERVHDDNLRR
jgi:antitoxin MazE